MAAMAQAKAADGGDLPFIRRVFLTPAFSWFWLVIRVYLGYEWLQAGRHKIVDSAWMSDGTALKGFWERVIVIPEQGRPPIAYGWYRDFLQFMLNHHYYVWFAKVVAVGELLTGIALLAGAFVGFAALTGAFMNINFMLAGSASTNPILFSLAILLLAAWKVAGYWGFDRFLIKALGTPWRPGVVVERFFRRPELRPGLGHRA